MTHKVLLVGNGAREHAIAKKIVQNEGTLYSYMSKENPGIADLSKKFTLGALTDFDKLKSFKKVDYAIVGPEAPLAAGITNYLEEQLDIPTCSPNREVAKIESSKIFARCLLDAYDISGNVPYVICSSTNDLENAVKEFGMNFVIKPDGLTGGKGVKVSGDHFNTLKEAKMYARELLSKNNEFLIEEKISGKEFSLQVFTDGTRIIPMPLVRDYKRAYVGEIGPNTGSLGSYSLASHDLLFLENRDIIQALDIMKQTIIALNKHTGIKYKGILYGQFMKSDTNLYLIEFNVRFGDPEAMNVLKILDSDYNKINLEIIDGNLSNVNFQSLATVCTYLVPEGYPISPATEEKIVIQDSIKSDLFYASVYRRRDKSICTTSSRALALLNTGKSLEEAKMKINHDLLKIKGKLFYREDIGELL